MPDYDFTHLVKRLTANSTCIDSRARTNKDAPWPFCPSLPAAILFNVAYLLATTIHVVLAMRYRKAFCWVLIAGTVTDFIGFLMRIVSMQYNNSLALYVPQQLAILLAPLWTNAFAYMVFGRLVHYFQPERTIAGIKARRLTFMFVLTDFVTFNIQALGGGLIIVRNQRIANIGLDIFCAGVGLQQLTLLSFVALVVLFHLRMSKTENWRPTSWRPSIYILYAVSALITTRTVYRLVEFASGFNSDIYHTEWYFYVFDALPMFAAVALFAAWHPGRALVGPQSEFPTMTKAEKRAERERTRQEKHARKG